jgi:hypothetical protein
MLLCCCDIVTGEFSNNLEESSLIKYVSSIRTLLLTIIVVLSSLTTTAQADGFRLASFSIEQVPSAEINLSGNEEEELQTSASTYTSKLAIPIKLDGRRRVLLHFITFRVLHQTYSNFEAAGVAFLPADLYTIKYGLVLRQVLSDQWSLNILVQPALLTDFKNVTSDDITVRGGFIFERKVSEKLTYAIGGGYSDDYGNGQVLPVGRIKWNPNQNWQVDLDFPQKVEISHKISGKMWIGISGKTTGGHYRIGEETSFRTNSEQRVDRVKYSIVNIGPSISLQTSKSFQLSLNGGTSVYRRYEVFDDDGAELNSANFESSVFVKATLRYLVGN